MISPALGIVRDLLDGVPICILWIKDGKVIYGNPAARDLLLRDHGILEGTEFSQLFHRDDWDRIEKVLHRTAKGLGTGEGYVCRMLRPDNSLLNVELEPTSIEGNGYGDMLVLVRDVTNEYHTQQRLRHVQKMEAVGQLAAGIAHDFNNVLGALTNYVKLLDRHVAGSDEAERYLGEMQELVDRGSALAQQILSFSAKRTEKRTAHDLHGVLKSVLRMLRQTLPKRIRIEVEEGEVPAFRMDAGKIQQVIMNLCMNATDAMPSGGDIRIRTQRGEVSEEIGENYLKLDSDAFAKVTVSDTGVGMDPEMLPRVFEPFFSTKAKEDRSGLGLSICESIVREHGGFIDVESEPGKGTTFSIILPLLEGRVQEEYTEISQAEGGQETLLLVDDETSMLESTADLLNGLGYRTITANGGPQAVDLFSQHKEEVNLVLLDLGMPTMDGAETFRRLRMIHPNVRVLLLTGLPQSEESQRALEEGVLDLIQKPFRLEDLTAKIRAALDKR